MLNGGTMTRSSRDLTATRPWCVFFFFSDPCWIEFTTITRVDSGDIYIYIYNIYIL